MVREVEVEVEEIAVEAVRIGDVVLVEAGPPAPRRVLALHTTRHGHSNCVVGWLVTLEGGQRIWLRRRARVLRQRLPAVSRN